MTDDATLRTLFDTCRTIAIVGLSDNPGRPSCGVARYLQVQGYRIVPVNPRLTQVLGEACYAKLEDIPFAVDMVDVFRRTEDVGPIADSAIAIGAKCLWQQIGVLNEAAHDRARAAGLVSVMDRCTKVEHARLVGLRR
jgi:hypothetical protein